MAVSQQHQVDKPLKLTKLILISHYLVVVYLWEYRSNVSSTKESLFFSHMPLQALLMPFILLGWGDFCQLIEPSQDTVLLRWFNETVLWITSNKMKSTTRICVLVIKEVDTFIAVYVLLLFHQQGWDLLSVMLPGNQEPFAWKYQKSMDVARALCWLLHAITTGRVQVEYQNIFNFIYRIHPFEFWTIIYLIQ